MKNVVIVTLALFSFIVGSFAIAEQAQAKKKPNRKETQIEPVAEGPEFGADGVPCSCAYFDFGPYWYGERFDEEGCTNATPVAIYNPPGAEVCTDLTNCDCSSSLLLREAIKKGQTISSQIFLPNPVDSKYKPQLPAGGRVTIVGGPEYVRITQIDSVVQNDIIYAVCYSLKLQLPKKRPVVFSVGFECTDPGRGATPSIALSAEPGNSVVKVLRSKKAILVRLTEHK